MIIFIKIVLFASLFVVGCGDPPMPPSDEEMIRHFYIHETAFLKVYEFISKGTKGSYYYPPYRPDANDSVILQIFEKIHGTPYKPFELYGEDSLYLHGLSPSTQMQLDSLLGITGCNLIHFYREKRGKTDSEGLSFTMVYYSHGILDAGISKSFVYDPRLRSNRNIRITKHGNLNEIYRRTYNDTTLYKPIKGNWYIELDHSR